MSATNGSLLGRLEIAVLASLALGLSLAVLHVYYGLGGQWWPGSSVDAVVGPFLVDMGMSTETFRSTSLMYGVIMAAAALFTLTMLPSVSGRLPAWTRRPSRLLLALGSAGMLLFAVAFAVSGMVDDVGQWAVYLIWMAAWAAVIILGLLESRAPRPAATASAAT